MDESQGVNQVFVIGFDEFSGHNVLGGSHIRLRVTTKDVCCELTVPYVLIAIEFDNHSRTYRYNLFRFK